MAVVYSKVLLFDPPLIYTAPDICVFGAVLTTVFYPKEYQDNCEVVCSQGPLVILYNEQIARKMVI